MSDTDDYDEYQEIRLELEAMTHSELVIEVISRIKSQRQMLIDNWHETEELRKEVHDSRSFITDTADQIQKWEEDVTSVVAKGLYWKRSFYLLLTLIMITLIFTYIQS
ncbi:hypothetical protein ACFODO_14510 [Acinetobacter sichuanensis]|uniref:Uncharacterized protein n=1 Tax=Acinetobacter sichuanensis TaxID=2136183 RepID=A0A371YJ45_9GAMM|nr:hypothetical protein [Acinetobacter sichuanensis]RFC81456.1 hypothetical protein C9E89_021780 [Acinetobacter sichuanensis]